MIAALCEISKDGTLFGEDHAVVSNDGKAS